MIKVQVKVKLKEPNFNFQNDLAKIAETIFIPHMAGYIDNGKDISGKKYASLAPATIAKKGHSRPLIETGALHSSFEYKKSGKSKVVITLNSDRKEIGKYLQIEGIKTKRGKRFFNFFGISRKMEKEAIGYMRNRINSVVKNAR